MTGTGLDGIGKSSHLSRKELEPRWIGGFYLPQPIGCLAPSVLHAPIHPPPTLSYLFLCSLPVPLDPYPCLCLPTVL